MAWMGMMSLQSGVLWWAVKHREHHRDSDTEADAHSPRHFGFWGAHMGWIFSDRAHVDYSLIKDFTKYPELMWLNKYDTVPGIVAAWACLLIGGLPGLFFGFIFSTILVYHATFMINSLAHVFGKQRYLTGDDSRNNWALGLIALGEGWHNNHHFYPGSARNGFFWWEIDITYYGLRLLEKLGLIWDLRVPPKSVLTGEKAPSSAIVDKVAAHIASGVNVEAIAERVRQRWEQQGRRIEEIRAELRQRAQRMKADAEAYLAEFELPEVPSIEELRQKARKKFANTPSLDEAVTRAQGMIRDSLSTQLMNEPSALPAKA
jgi:stearoyl-CoA desaturase (delta-9 desaturase)